MDKQALKLFIYKKIYQCIHVLIQMEDVIIFVCKCNLIKKKKNYYLIVLERIKQINVYAVMDMIILIIALVKNFQIFY